MDILSEEPGINQFARDRFNNNLAEHMDGWKEFVEAHYYYSRRTDTAFWRDATTQKFNLKDTDHDYIQYHMTGGDPSYSYEVKPILYILAGSGYTIVGKRRYEHLGVPPVPESRIRELNEGYQTRKELASILPTMYKYLKETVFS